MGAPDRIRRRLSGPRQPAPPAAAAPAAQATPEEEARLWAVLRQDPNDVTSFHALADIVRRRAAEGHREGDPHRAADDAVWALAEELAHSGRAWYPLVELARALRPGLVTVGGARPALPARRPRPGAQALGHRVGP